MGITAEQFWQTSTNGKEMLLMLARRNNPELVRGACDWLVSAFKVDVTQACHARGATAEQARIVANDRTAHLYALVESIDERNQALVAEQVMNTCFLRHFNAGKAKYDQALGWLADELRRRVKNDDQH